MSTGIGTRRCHYFKLTSTFRHNGAARPIFPPYTVTRGTWREAQTGDTWLCLDLTPDVYEKNMTSVEHPGIHILNISGAVVDSPKTFRFCFCYFDFIFSTIANLICSSAETITCHDKFLGSFIEQFRSLFYFICYQFTVDVFIP